jgi:glycosyltransferase involved in cell wall biosynthesis
MKILSIIVPAYNMEDYLERCLNSVLDHKWDEDLEVIVVNDGSKDRTLQITLAYKEKFSEIVTIIDKENGNYGSTINAALPVAKGKYVKVLDADDWFDTKEFERFIEQLKNVDADLVISDFTINYSSGKKEKMIYSAGKEDKIYDFSIMLSPPISWVAMHAISYKTELLRKMNYRQTEGIFYTDLEWALCPMFFVHTIAIVNANVYQYYVGREGQTVDIRNTLKNISQLRKVNEKLLDYYYSFDKSDLSKAQQTYLLDSIKKLLIRLYKTYLIFQSDKEFNALEMKKFDEYIYTKDSNLYMNLSKAVVHKFLPIPFIRYWRKYSKRLPQKAINFLLVLKRKYA